MINFYNPKLPRLMTEYFTLLPQIMLLSMLINAAFRQVGMDVPVFDITDVLPFMYEGIIVALNGVDE